MFRTVLGQTAGFAVLPFIPVAVAQTAEGPGREYGYRHGPGMMWGADSWGGFGWPLGLVLMILVLAGIVVGIFYLLRAMGVVSPRRKAAAQPASALAVLQERFARGEMDSKEFEERRRLLSQ